MNETPATAKTERPAAPRNASSWAQPVDKLSVGDVPTEAINLNVAGRRVTGPLHGFGQMWQKTYSIRLTGTDVSPTQVIEVWKAKFPDFWPGGNRFYGPLKGVAPGDVAVLNLSMPGGMKVSTGIRVIYADDESFAFITPEGHTFGGLINFSAEENDGTTVVQIQALVRASDPIYEIGCRLGFGHKMEDNFWHGTLRNLATHFGSDNAEVNQKTVCVDKKVQWSEAKNVWQNAFIRTAVYMPVHVTKRLFRRS